MSDQVLARKWRPRTFEDVVGQDHVRRALTNAMGAGRLHHAYLFSGTRGVGKTTLARILARCLNCEQGVSAQPCGECGACRELLEGRFVDLIEVDAASRTKVEDTRELLDNVQYAPTVGRFKIYLIDEVHMLSTHSFNALLKTLEEPPPHVKFLLATTDPQRLPATVLSRCLQFHLKRVPSGTLRGRLEAIAESEGLEWDRGALARLARAADGSVRDALSLLDQAVAFAGVGPSGHVAIRDDEVAAMLGSVERHSVLDLLEALAAGDGDALLRKVREVTEDGVDPEDVLGELTAATHQLALIQQVPGMLEEDDPARGRWLALAEAVAAEDLQLYYQIGLQGRRDLPYAPDPATGFEMTLLRMLAFRPADAPPRPPPASAPPAVGEPEGAVAGTAGNDAGPGPATADAVSRASDSEADGGAAAQWNQWAGELDGLLGAMASHCEWVERREERVILRLDRSHEYLLDQDRVGRLERFVAERCPGVTRLEVQVGDVGRTPAEDARERAAAARQRAQEALDHDPVFGDLKESFGATVQEIAPPRASDADRHPQSNPSS